MNTTFERLASALADRYRVERELGAGGMATVFLAHDIKHERDVAIKVLHPDLGAALGAERFLAEIKTTAKLQHPHILPLLDSGVASDLLYYVMPYVRGETLRARLERGPIPADEALTYLRDVARALQYAHAEGILHRDVKPENVLLSSGTAVLADLGIAKALSVASTIAGGESALTRTGTSIGTPAYMAPEQAAADPALDTRADVYAWGMVAWETLAGRHPFGRERSPQAMLTAQLTEMPVPLAESAAADPAISSVVQRALAKDPEDRYASAGELLVAFDTARRDGTSVERVAAPGQGTAPATNAAGARRPRLALLIAATLALAAALVGAVKWWTARAGGRDAVRTIAVIPVVTGAADSVASYVADGIVDDLTSLLQAEPTLRVINRASAFALRGRTIDLAKVSAQLGVDHVVEVSGRTTTSGYRLAVDLVDVGSGVARWSRQFDAARDSVAALPTRMAGGLLENLRRQGVAAVGASHAPSPEAYDAFLRGRFFRQRLSQPTDVDSARAYLFKASALDPAFAAPYAVLAALYVEISGTVIRVPEAYAMADSMARRAVSLDPRNAEALAVRGWSALVREWDWDAAARDLDAAVLADPNSSSVRFLRALYRSARGESAGALEDARTGSQRDPLYPTTWFIRVYTEDLQGHLDSALAAQRHLDVIAPGFTLINSNIAEVFRRHDQPDSAFTRDTIADRFVGTPTAGTALSLLALGRRAEAEAHYARMQDAYRRKPMLPESMARVASALGRRSEALDWMEQAANEHSDLLFFWTQVPEIRSLMNEPRMQALLDRTHAPPSLRRALGLTQ